MYTNRTIVHIYGPQCAGKTTLLKDVPSNSIWDVSDLYRKHGYNPEGKPNPYLANKLQGHVIRSLSHFINDQPGPWVIESSGTNKKVNEFLSACKEDYKIIQIAMRCVDGLELARRIALRGMSPSRVLAFNKRWKPISKGHLMEADQARDTIERVFTIPVSHRHPD